MRVDDMMRGEARTVSPGSNLAAAGRLMAEVGCGVLPVVGDGGRVVGVVTDRDLCLTLARLDRRPSEIPVSQAMSREVHACAVGDDLRRALATMATFRVRRLPVLGPDGTLHGILSLDDVALVAHEQVAGELGDVLYADVARTLAAVCEHPTPALAR
jgi:CBS domain-containing protein